MAVKYLPSRSRMCCSVNLRGSLQMLSSLVLLKSKDELKGGGSKWLDHFEWRLGADTVIKKLEVWYQPKLGNHRWLMVGSRFWIRYPWHWFHKKFSTTTHFYDSSLHCRFPSRIGQAIESNTAEEHVNARVGGCNWAGRKRLGRPHILYRIL